MANTCLNNPFSIDMKKYTYDQYVHNKYWDTTLGWTTAAREGWNTGVVPTYEMVTTPPHVAKTIAGVESNAPIQEVFLTTKDGFHKLIEWSGIPPLYIRYASLGSVLTFKLFEQRKEDGVWIYEQV